MALTTEQKILLWVGGILIAVPLALWLKRKLLDTRRYSLSSLVNIHTGRPVAVAISSQVGTDVLGDDQFILSAWKMVGEGIEYEDKGSIIVFDQNVAATPVRCELCDVPAKVLARGKANCVGKSLLLASILRNRFPASRVYCVVGKVHDITDGGHMWVVIQRNGGWYILESTSPPVGWQWEPAVEGLKYQSTVLLNDKELICTDEELCVQVQESKCLPCMLASAA